MAKYLWLALLAIVLLVSCAPSGTQPEATSVVPTIPTSTLACTEGNEGRFSPANGIVMKYYPASCVEKKDGHLECHFRREGSPSYLLGHHDLKIVVKVEGKEANEWIVRYDGADIFLTNAVCEN